MNSVLAVQSVYAEKGVAEKMPSPIMGLLGSKYRRIGGIKASAEISDNGIVFIERELRTVYIVKR